MGILNDMLKSVGKGVNVATGDWGPSIGPVDVGDVTSILPTPAFPYLAGRRVFRSGKWVFQGVTGRGKGRQAEDDTAPNMDMTSTDQWNAATMAEYAQASLIPEFQTRIQKQGGFAEGDTERLLSITNMMNESASPQDLTGVKYQIIQSQMETAAMEGWLDDPEGEQLFNAFIDLNRQDQQFQMTEQGMPVTDPYTQMVMDETAAQAQREQIEFERAGVTDFLQMLPAQIRVQAIISMIDKPFFQQLFLGGMEGGISGGGSAGGPPTTLQETADFLGSFGSR